MARPDDWTGTLSRVAVGTATVLSLAVVALVRLPPAWIEAVGGHGWVVRALIVVPTVLLLMGARALLIARLPRAAVLFGRRVRFHDGTRRVVVPVDAIARLHVEHRPPPLFEVFVVERRDGTEQDVCPTHWWGAPRLHRTLSRKVSAATRRRRKAKSRARRRAPSPDA